MPDHSTKDTNQAGLDLIKAAEGFRANLYKCPAGVWTVGYGTTAAAGFNLRSLKTPVSREKAEQMLAQSLDRLYEPEIERSVRVALTENQFSALASFIYNVGTGNFRRSTLLKKLNRGDYQGAAGELLKWTRGGGRVLPGLVKRRRAERELFLSPDAVAQDVATKLEVELATDPDPVPMPQKVMIVPIDPAPLHDLPVRFSVDDYIERLSKLPGIDLSLFP